MYTGHLFNLIGKAMKRTTRSTVFGIFLLGLGSVGFLTQAKAFPLDVPREVQVLGSAAPSLNHTVLNLALIAYNHAVDFKIAHKPILTVIDYSLASSKPRLWIFDLSRNRLLYNTYVAHGANSGDLYATRFSNLGQSHESSLGTYVTGNTYYGSKGYALNLRGLEQGFNDNALSRRVVIHGAWYVSENFAHQYGRLGRSWGCPSVSQSLATPIINTLKDGSILFIYYPDRQWLSHSRYLTA